ncbi:MAG: hypothetical protein H6672_05450 [Anaerolineaceae bacterium]|nr:hypothetical protein [Anaerolineaceae bacterium]
MRKLNVLLVVIGIAQIVLSLLYLLAPMQFLALMGSSTPEPDLAYPLGMLAARFLAYGLGMFYIARAREKQLFWINNMILIQIIDLAVGMFYTATGTVALSSSALPMFDAALFIVLLTLWRPQAAPALQS